MIIRLELGLIPTLSELQKFYVGVLYSWFDDLRQTDIVNGQHINIILEVLYTRDREV